MSNSNLVLRTFSAIIIVAFILFPLIWMPKLLILTIYIIAFFMLQEWYNITKLNKIHLLLGLILIPIPLTSIILIDNSTILIYYFCLIWFVDVFAMFFGKLMKGPKLAKKLSPNKTSSRFICGITVSALLITYIDIVTDFSISKHYQIYSTPHFLLICISISATAQLSDLLVSYFKRCHNVKDSGNIIPGHGGMLDRFDSIILTAPMVFLYLNYPSL